MLDVGKVHVSTVILLAFRAIICLAGQPTAVQAGPPGLAPPLAVAHKVAEPLAVCVLARGILCWALGGAVSPISLAAYW